MAIGDSRSGYHVHQISGVKWQSGTWKKLEEILLLINFVSLIIVHSSYRSSLAAPDTCRKSFVSRFDTKKSCEIVYVPDYHLTPLIWRNWSKMKYYKTSKYPNLIKNLFKRSNFQVISQFIHVKDISKVNDNGNQYKQKLILWYWTKNYFLMGFTASKIYFYFGTISMFWNLKATISHEFQYLNYSKH